jgi:hypothetical protein
MFSFNLAARQRVGFSGFLNGRGTPGNAPGRRAADFLFFFFGPWLMMFDMVIFFMRQL